MEAFADEGPKGGGNCHGVEASWALNVTLAPAT